MNLTTAISELRSKIGNPTTANVSDATLTSKINQAYAFVAARYPFSELRLVTSFNTTQGTDRYTLPSNLQWIKRVWDDTNKVKIYKRGAPFVANLPLNLPQGKPKWYFRTDDWIQIIPQVDATYSLMLYYQGDPDPLVAGTDTFKIPLAWHDGIILKARHIYYDGMGDIGKSIYAKNEWKDWVADKPTELDMEKEDLDDAGIELPELSQTQVWRDPRFDPLFDTTL